MNTLRFRILALITLIAVLILVKQLLINKNHIRPGSPNLILISVDTLRSDHIGVYGYDKGTTPNIDKWSSKATIYKNASTIFPETQQSFYTLFTGTDDFLATEFNTQRNVIRNPEIIDRETLAENLNSNGYKTSAYITNPVLGNIFPRFFQRGFNEYIYINVSGSKENNDSFKFDFENSEKVTMDALNWLKTNKNDKFFLWLHYTTPHMPYNPPMKYLCKIDENCKNKEYEKLLKENSPFSTYLKSCTQEETSKNIVEKSINLYDAEILSVDDQIGKVLREIDNLGLDKNTVVIFYADHGEGFDHRIYGHSGALYNSSIHIPFIVKTPNQKERKIISSYIQNFDMKSIILDALDSQKNQFKEKANNENGHFFAKTTLRESNKQTVFNDKYKYILSNSKKCLYNNYTEELYNIKEDPSESKNIISEYPDLALKMKSLLQNKVNNSSETNTQELNDTVEKLKSLGY